jgi:hypothetical protein
VNAQVEFSGVEFPVKILAELESTGNRGKIILVDRTGEDRLENGMDPAWLGDHQVAGLGAF